MTYRAPIPVGPEDETWTETLSVKNAFAGAVVALTDSSLALQKSEEVIEDPELKATLLDMRDRRHNSLREVREMGIAASLRADDVDTSGTETLRRTWMTIKSRVTDSAAVLKVLIDEEENTAGNLKAARSHTLPTAVDNVVGSAIVQIEDDINVLRKAHSKL
jgi:isopentenyl diphosphate isomerase/L-lactate dehydrogenase-like FMN-dependent dehydrogenase